MVFTMRYKEKIRYIGCRVDAVISEFFRGLPYGQQTALLTDIVYDRIESENPHEHIHRLMRNYESGRCNSRQFIKQFMALKERYIIAKRRHDEARQRYGNAVLEIRHLESEGVLNQAIAKLNLEEEQKTLDFIKTAGQGWSRNLDQD